MTDAQVLAMPIRRFWLFVKNINRISAVGDVRALTIANSAQSGEAAQKVHERLTLEIGSVSKTARAAEKLDREGLKRLKALAG